MRHPEGGYVLQELAGVERLTDFYGRESLVLHFKEGEGEPVAVLLTNYSRPGKPHSDGQEWLIDALEEDGDGKWGKVPKESVTA